MRKDEFRQNDELVKWVASVMRHKNWRIVMETMMDEHPMNYVLTAALPEHSDSKRLGIIEGYNQFRDTLAALKEPIPVTKELIPSYAPLEEAVETPP